MSVTNSEASVARGSGRYLRRLETLESMVVEYKNKCDQLEAKCVAFEKWKVSAEEWLYENFDVVLDPLDEAESKVVVENGSETSGAENSTSVAPSAIKMKSAERQSSIRSSSPQSISPVIICQRNSSTTGTTNGIDGEFVIPFVIKAERGESDVAVENISITEVRSLIHENDNEKEELTHGQELSEDVPQFEITPSSDSNSTIALNCVPSSSKASSSMNMNGGLLSTRSSSSSTIDIPISNKEQPLMPSVTQSDDQSFLEQTLRVSPRKSKDNEKNIICEPNGDKTESSVQAETEKITIKKISTGNHEVSFSSGSNGYHDERSHVKRKLDVNGVQPSASTSGQVKGQTMAAAAYIKNGTPVRPAKPRLSQSSLKQNGMDDDDLTPCDVCGAKEPELGNKMVFCEGCNVCVHQACYGIRLIPAGTWVCNPCRAGLDPKALPCYFCPKLGGALKPVRSPAKKHWAHVSCALWIPEVKMACEITMEPVINVNSIPEARWKLKCSLCNIKKGAPIQCQYSKRCTRAFHVTCAMQFGLEMQGIVDEHLSDGCVMTAHCKVHSHIGNSGDPDKKSGSPRKKRRVV